MSDIDNTQPAAAKKVYATLVRGSIYVYHDKTFEAGVPVEVTAAQAAYLAEHAVDVITVEDEEVLRPKFSISHDGEIVSGETKSRPRTRAR